MIGPYQGMLEREKVRTSAAIATALTVSTGNRISTNGAFSSLQLPNDRYACHTDSIYSVPRNDLHEVEWVEPDSVDAEVSRLVTDSSTTTTTTRNNPRRCYRTSTSSGYSSQSPPLSAGSYSYYATAGPGQAIFRATAPQNMKDQLNGSGLAVIHEGEAIPRPIWPSAFANVPRELYIRDDGKTEYDRVYACCNCGCTYAYSYCDWNCGRSTVTSAQEILLELSRTLDSVIEGETTMTPEEILHNISRTVAQGIDLRRSSIYEYVRHNPPWLNCGKNAFSILSSKNSSQSIGKGTSSLQSRTKLSTSSSSTGANPVNSKLYGSTRKFRNSSWSSTPRCTCDPSGRILAQQSRQGVTDQGSIKKIPTNAEIHSPKPMGLCTCKCFKGTTQQSRREQNTCGSIYIGDKEKQAIVGLDNLKQNRNGLTSGESEYTLQLEYSEGGLSNERMVKPSTKSTWNHQNTKGFIGDLDFTLDVARAERLGRAIAKAKRNRQWCRALTALFGLVFFVLSVVIVSLLVTRGRKIFGSM